MERTESMRALVGITFMCLLVLPAWGQDRQRAQVIAATNHAVQGLLEQVSRQPLDDRVSAGELVEATGGLEVLLATLQRARQIGGARWIDEETCQVKLAIDGAPVAAALSKIAASNPETTPIDAQPLQWALRDWDRKTFIATGSSVGPGLVENPPEPGPDSGAPATQPAAGAPPPLVIRQVPSWIREQRYAVGEASDAGSKLRTARQAEGEARQVLLEQIMRLPLTDDQSIGQVASRRPTLKEAVSQAVERARVYSSDYRADGSVEVKVFLDLRDLWQQIVLPR